MLLLIDDRHYFAEQRNPISHRGQQLFTNSAGTYCSRCVLNRCVVVGLSAHFWLLIFYYTEKQFSTLFPSLPPWFSPAFGERRTDEKKSYALWPRSRSLREAKQQTSDHQGRKTERHLHTYSLWTVL